MPALSSENFGRKEKLLLAFVIPVLVWTVYYRKFYKPQQREMKKLSSSIRSIERRIRDVQREQPEISFEKRKLRQLEARHSTVKEKVKTRQGKLFRKDEIPFLIQLLTEHITPSIDLIYMRAQQSKKTDFYKKFPIQMSFISKFSSAIMYIDNIEKLSPLVQINDFNMGSDKNTSLVKTNLVISALFCEDSGKVERSELLTNSSDSLLEVRDPFIPLVVEEEGKPQVLKKTDEPAIKLQGIIWGEENIRTAVINGKVLRQGDEIDGNEVVTIEKDKVTLKKGDREYSLMLKVFEEN